MELLVVITVLCFSFLALQTPCTSLQIQLQSSTEQGAAKGVQLSLPTLPRKLRFTEELVEFKGNGAQHSISNTKQKEDVSGEKARGVNPRPRGKHTGTRKLEFMEVEAQGKNGWRAPTFHNILRWIIPM